ncbi:MAG: deoxyribose-phosphate aldolase [Defluviitaleaceae bacterium]|nr:deoxyribose-phosphate aldolase [Defluviitaleaceae bacterium]
MDNSKIYALVDHTLLAPTASWEAIAALCDEAIQYKTASVCIPPSFIKRVHEKYGNAIAICTVIGFPLGYSCLEAKKCEIEKAIQDGAAELDVVINIGDAKAQNFDKITAELTALKKASGDKILKVIIECCYLSEDEKIALCKCVTDSGADYIKTSTGFGTGGATLEDIKLFKAHIGPHVKIKAAGGMRIREDFIAFINEGCLRLGTSAAVKVLSGEAASGAY